MGAFIEGGLVLNGKCRVPVGFEPARSIGRLRAGSSDFAELGIGHTLNADETLGRLTCLAPDDSTEERRGNGANAPLRGV